MRRRPDFADPSRGRHRTPLQLFQLSGEPLHLFGLSGRLKLFDSFGKAGDLAGLLFRPQRQRRATAQPLVCHLS